MAKGLPIPHPSHRYNSTVSPRYCMDCGARWDKVEKRNPKTGIYNITEPCPAEWSGKPRLKYARPPETERLP
jgi:hypothetical protein